MEKMALYSKFNGHFTEIILQRKMRGPLKNFGFRIKFTIGQCKNFGLWSFIHHFFQPLTAQGHSLELP